MRLVLPPPASLPPPLEIPTANNLASPLEHPARVRLVVAYPVLCAPVAVECGRGSLSTAFGELSIPA